MTSVILPRRSCVIFLWRDIITHIPGYVMRQTAFVCSFGADTVYIGVSDDGTEHVVYVIFLLFASGGKGTDSESVLSVDRLSDPDLSDWIL